MDSKWRCVAAILLFVYTVTAEFNDGIQEYEENCLGENKYQCMDGGCINQDQYCDGTKNCRDGSDEMLCTTLVLDEKQCNETHKYICADHSRCIPLERICNMIGDCDDNSDEENCTFTGSATGDVYVTSVTSSNCTGYTCSNGTCISPLWVCDGVVDCLDRGDEENLTLCREIKGHNNVSHADIRYCDPLDLFIGVTYKCLDNSFCLRKHLMCDGVKDCRDGSDEGNFCSTWKTQCDSDYCKKLDVGCRPDRLGPECVCRNESYFSRDLERCVPVDQCGRAEPVCSQFCHTSKGSYSCKCEEGYLTDRFSTMCFAPDPEPLLFFSTKDSIGYISIRSRIVTVLLDKLKEPHGVSYDGEHVYWVETAEGHQAILRAKLDNMNRQEILVALGLEDPGDIAIDWLGGHFYFSDAERGHIGVCELDGALCTVLNTTTRHPRFVTLNPLKGDMYWVDWHNKPVIMHAKMDGSQPTVFFNQLKNFPTGLTLDIPSGRMYFCDGGVQVVKLDGIARHVLFDDPFHHPYSISVFENSVYFSDFASNTVQFVHKMDPEINRRMVAKFDKAVFGMHMYHPLLMKQKNHGCINDSCSDMCLINGDMTKSCACAEDRKKVTPSLCVPISFKYAPEFLIVGGGHQLTRIKYNALGNPETRAVNLDIGNVRAMAYNNNLGILYIFDNQRRILYSLNMTNFADGNLTVVNDEGLDAVIDMDYDYVTNSLYYVEAIYGVIGVISLDTKARANVYKFKNRERPLSITVIPKYGKMVIAVMAPEENDGFFVESFGLDGKNRTRIVKSEMKSLVDVRYSHQLDKVLMSNLGAGVIEAIHPDGSGRETFRAPSTSVTSLAVSETTVFWTNHQTPRIFWAELHETGQNYRRMELTIFPNKTQLHIQSTKNPPELSDPLFHHPCHTQKPCSHICVQSIHPPPQTLLARGGLDTMGYTCLCPPGRTLNDHKCEKMVTCIGQLHCSESNTCVDGKQCDKVKDCPGGEDEEYCETTVPPKRCGPLMKLCRDECVALWMNCKDRETECTADEFQCRHDKSICIQRWQLCDAQYDCRDGSDEDEITCKHNTCLDTEMMCASGSCVLKTWRCDGDNDCADGSDEVDCDDKVCTAGFYRCESGDCVEVSKRCDGHQDCMDFSDEDDCEEDTLFDIDLQGNICMDNEYTCALNKSICLPITARCDHNSDCPGGTDELDCAYYCPHDTFKCDQEMFCIPMFMACDGVAHCRDKSDETVWACQEKNRANKFSTPPSVTQKSCKTGFECKNGQCIEWVRVCDNVPDCYDLSDEAGNCSKACLNHNCPDICKATPSGPVCMCPAGYKLDVHLNTCVDIDECEQKACSQKCHNYPGSFICSCNHGYALRSDRRTCKATSGNMSLIYVAANAVKWVSHDGRGGVEFESPEVQNITDLDYDVRRQTLYVTSTTEARLVQSTTKEKNYITNIGIPSKVAVDWITGNVFFVDSTPDNKMMRVCNFAKKKCAKLQKLPSDAEIPALIVDPANKRMFYCVSQQKESVIWISSFSGLDARDLITVHNCTGLAVDSFKKKLYFAESNPSHITSINYDGDDMESVISSDPHVTDPHHLALFEDYLYILSTTSFKITRCSLYTKHCIPYIYRMFDANTFVLRHESAQRDDVTDDCEGIPCDGVCVLDDRGKVCVCGDGSKEVQGSCPQLDENELLLFDGQEVEKKTGHLKSWIVAIIVIVVIAVAIMMAVYYFYMKRRTNLHLETVVRYFGGGVSADPTVRIPVGEERRDFLNPVQYVRRAWNNRHYTRNQSVASTSTSNDPTEQTAGPSDKMRGPSEDPSDTESDMDLKDTKNLFSLN